jgi:hypothetical protein
MSSVLRGLRLHGRRLQTRQRDGDGTLAARDTRIQALKVLDVELLLELANELTHIALTRSETGLATGRPTFTATSAELGS